MTSKPPSERRRVNNRPNQPRIDSEPQKEEAPYPSLTWRSVGIYVGAGGDRGRPRMGSARSGGCQAYFVPKKLYTISVTYQPLSGRALSGLPSWPSLRVPAEAVRANTAND